jgi:hypothetical protein
MVELNNKEFAMYPSMRTLDGMMRQGQFRVIETIYSPGAIYRIVLFITAERDQRVTAPQRRNLLIR